MGATGWSFFRPYQEDMHTVLEVLQQDVFLSGNYGRPLFDIDFLEEIEFFEADLADQWEMLKQYGLDSLQPIIQEVGVEGLSSWLEQLRRKPIISSVQLS